MPGCRPQTAWKILSKSDDLSSKHMIFPPTGLVDPRPEPDEAPAGLINRRLPLSPPPVDCHIFSFSSIFPVSFPKWHISKDFSLLLVRITVWRRGNGMKKGKERLEYLKKQQQRLLPWKEQQPSSLSISINKVVLHPPCWHVSIHTPAWGATGPQFCLIGKFSVSIHAPAWGATVNP